ncbi:MAG TPA: hypothetical protein PKL84_10455 [Candidatus Hydrogenedentes bacterium]|nr:hypothetical protein [Candidatus Hydrogenedentota bacterium]
MSLSDLSGYVSGLIVEDGSGKTDADSYVSVTDADIYVTDRYTAASTWLDLTEDQKEAFLRRACQFLDSYFRGKWKGVKRTSTQSLAWPRASVLDEEGYLIADDSVPPVVIEAQIESALILHGGYDLQAVLSGTGTVTRQKVGEIEVEYDGNVSIYAGRTKAPKIMEMLSGVITSGGRVYLA